MHDHRHHQDGASQERAHPGTEQPPAAARREPGYPAPPELAHEHRGHGAHGGHDEHAGHDRHAGHSVAMFRDKFWISLALTIPILVWGHMFPRVLVYTPAHFPV